MDDPQPLLPPQPDPELEHLRLQLAEKDELITLKDFELKEKELNVKQLRSQLFDKECRFRDLNAKVN